MFRSSSTTQPPSSSPDPAKLVLRPSECHVITLPDKRDLGYSIYGSQNTSDPAIFLFHGMPGCRLVGRGFDKVCQRARARLITIDRPGCGLSTYADRGLADWPADVLAVANHLGIQKFSVLGASGGGPFALACARFIGRERLGAAVVVCGIGPIESLLQGIPDPFGWTTGLLRLVAQYIVLPRLLAPYDTTDPSRLKRVLEDQCKTPEEKAQIHNPDADSDLDDVVMGLLETFRQGDLGCKLDGSVLSREWAFDLKNVDSKRVWLVHGDQDVQVPLKMAQYVDEKLGGGRLRVLRGKTHFTIWKDHAEEIFRSCAYPPEP